MRVAPSLSRPASRHEMRKLEQGAIVHWRCGVPHAFQGCLEVATSQVGAGMSLQKPHNLQLAAGFKRRKLQDHPPDQLCQALQKSPPRPRLPGKRFEVSGYSCPFPKSKGPWPACQSRKQVLQKAIRLGAHESRIGKLQLDS